jgi:hypothetical protein
MDHLRAEYFRLGKEVRELMHLASLFKDDIGTYKSVKKRVLYHPREDSKPVYDLMYKLDFRIMNNWHTSGHHFWSVLDSACGKDCNGEYEIVSFSENATDPNRPRLPDYEVLDHDYHMTQNDYRAVLAYCERLNKWVDDSLALIMKCNRLNADRKADGLKYSKRYKTIVNRLLEHVKIRS